jgi:hypothetical protein
MTTIVKRRKEDALEIANILYYIHKKRIKEINRNVPSNTGNSDL